MMSDPKRCLAWILTAGVLLALSPLARADGFTLEQILSSPFPSSLTVAPDGNRLAWVFNERGVRNVWVAEGPEFAARKITSFGEDDGRGLSIVGFTPDSELLIFARGSRFNPAHDPAGPAESKLYSIAWSGGAPQEIAKASGGAVSPTENRVAYTQGGKVWSAAVGATGEPTELLSLRGTLVQLRWSPDGGKLTLTSRRGERPYRYSYVVVYDLAAKSVRYIDPGVYLDMDPSWSPDGAKIAFLRRLNSDREFVLTARSYPQPDPWLLRVHDLASGETHTAWRAPEKDNFGAGDVEWIDDQTLVFTSELDGWRHLYRVPQGGGEPRQLTRGNFEVEDFLTVPETGEIWLTSNKDDIDRRHLWSVDGEGKLQALTRGESIEWGAQPLAGGERIAHFGSDARNPAQVFVRPRNGGEPARLASETLPSDFPLDELVVPRQIVFRAADGLEIHGQLFLPPPRYDGRRPTLMYFHGGPIRQMLLGWHYRGYYHNAYAMNQYLASRGYVVLSVNFRLGIGYGRAFRDVPDGGPRGASEYQDLLAGAAYLRSLEHVDVARIGLWGGSYGGLMTALGLARNSDLFAAGVDFHGVHDWNRWQAWATGGENDDDRLTWKSSPVADLDAWRSPVLLIHADDDRNVDFSETLLLAQELARRGVEHELLIFPDDVHSFLLHANWLRAYEATAEFFDRKLGSQVPATTGDVR